MRPTFHESWYRVSGLKPRLRTTVQVTRQHFRGQRWYVVRDPANNQHFRLDDAGYMFVGLLDGRRTIKEAWQTCSERLGDRGPTQGEAINLLGQLYTNNLLQSDLPPDAAGMFDSYRQRVRREVKSLLTNLLFIRIPLFDPDALLTRWEKLLSPVFGRWGLMAWLGLLVFAAIQLAGRWHELVEGATAAIRPDNLVLLGLCFAVIKGLHELGHAFVTKRLGRLTGQGGEVHTLGITLLVFTPVPYVDASSAWAFRSKWHRAFVGAAGMYVELAVAAIAAIVWANTSPGLVHALAYNVILIAGVSTIVFNGNPLLRFDGYYILSDLLETPNLARRGRESLFYLVKRYVYGLRRAVSPALTPGERYWLPTYGVSSLVYRIVVFVTIVLFVMDRFFVIGAALALTGIVSWLIVPVCRFVRYLLAGAELARVRKRAVLTTSVFAAIVIVDLGLVPAPERALAEGVMEPADVALLYAQVEGFVEDVTPTGRTVSPSEPLVVLRNLDLETQRERLLADRKLTVVQSNRAALEEVALAQSLERRIEAIDDQLRRLDERLAAMTVRAPIGGEWISPDIERRPGSVLEPGDPVGMIASTDRLLVRAVADQRLGPRITPEIGPGAAVSVRVRGQPDLAFEGQISDVLPAGSQDLPSAALGYLGGGWTPVAEDGDGRKTVEPFFEVHIEVPRESVSENGLCSGQRVVVRFELPRRPLLVQWWRSVRQLVQRRFSI